MDIGIDCLYACTVHFDEMCELLDEQLDETSFWSGYLTYEVWKTVGACGLPRAASLPLAS